MTWFVLRWWYGFHRAKYLKWEARKHRWDKKRAWKSRANKVIREKRIYRKFEHHRFWFDHYCTLMGAYGHKIDCIHFGEGENTIQANTCPYHEDWCVVCDGKIFLNRGRWEHYLTYYDDCVTPRNDHLPDPKCEHWPHTLYTSKRVPSRQPARPSVLSRQIDIT